MTCPDCAGSGVLPLSPPITCPICWGSGHRTPSTRRALTQEKHYARARRDRRRRNR